MPLLWLPFGESGRVAAVVGLLFWFGMDSKVYIVRYHILMTEICPKRDLLYVCGTQIQKVEKMLNILLLTIWTCFASYLLWYVTSAKRNVTITHSDAKALWKIHKKSTKCSGHKWRPTSRRNGKISGFECECGYKYTQKRPIISSMPKPRDQTIENATVHLVSSY